METGPMTSRRLSRSTDEQRQRIYKLLLARPDRTLEADSLPDAWRKLGLHDEKTGMPVGVFKNAIGHLAHPVRIRGEKQYVYHVRKTDGQAKASPTPHIWRALATPA